MTEDRAAMERRMAKRREEMQENATALAFISIGFIVLVLLVLA